MSDERKFTAEQWCALMLTGTVCLAILFALAGMCLVGPERVNQTGREGLIALVSMCAGIVSGYLLRSSPRDV